jgi:AbrB family looped-hinge helix DNA binding protein
MKLRIDKSGRILIPKILRQRLGFKPGTELELLHHPDGLLLRAVAQHPAMIRFDGLWVHCGIPEPGANWNRVVQEVRDERIESILKS